MKRINKKDARQLSYYVRDISYFDNLLTRLIIIIYYINILLYVELYFLSRLEKQNNVLVKSDVLQDEAILCSSPILIELVAML